MHALNEKRGQRLRRIPVFPWIARLAAWLASLIALAGGAAAQDAAEFYKGRTLSLVVGHEVGTGYDLYGRVLARHIGRHVTGTPNVVPQNIFGGGGLHAASWLATIAPRDGSVVAIFAHTAILDPLLGSGLSKYDSTKFNWIGNMDETVSTCVVWHTTGVDTFDELLARPTIYGGSGGPLTQFPAAIHHLLGAKGRRVQGYKGSADIKLALQRGEIEATCGLSISTLSTQWRDVVERGKLKPVAQFGRKPHPLLGGIAHIYSYARNDDDVAIFDLIFGASSLGRPLAAPPGVPPERVAALREGFMRTMADPAFLADAAQAKLDIQPSSGADIQAQVAGFFSASSAVVGRARAAIQPD